MMIHYECCTQVAIEQVYEAFMRGFSDYIIKMDISKEGFIKRFFGPEGNELAYSFIALDGAAPVGLILGGIKSYEGIQTIRCGALCINPEYRGTGVSQELFRLHRQVALDQGCKQMFLEVIAGNDRAIQFYSKLGYEKIYDIRYYSHADAQALTGMERAWPDIRKVDFRTILDFSDRMADIHINWQNELDYVARLEGIVYYGCFDDSKLIGGLGISSNGKIFFLWTLPGHRQRKVAASLIAKAVEELQLKKLSISTPNNSSLEGFLRHQKFEKDPIAQYEMYLTL